MSNEQDKAIIERTIEALDQQTEQIDYRTQLHLQKAREQALAELDKKPAKKAARGWLWLTAVPAALAVVMLLPLGQKSPATMPEQLVLLQDVELLTAGADLEMLEDIEFYQWLAEQEQLEEA